MSNTATPERLGLNAVEDFPQYLDSDDVSKEIERYVWFPGDIISPRRKQETRETTGIGLYVNGGPFYVTRAGGDEYQTPCLTRTKGIVPRGFFTPLEVAAHWIPPELLPYGADAFRANAENGPHIAGGILVGAKSQYLVGEKVYPGHALSWMMSFARNDHGFSRGLVEVEILRAQPWKDGAAQELQRVFLPDYPHSLMPTLSGLQERITSVTREASGDIRQLGQLLLHSCDEYREWGTAFIGREHNLVKMGTTDQGWTYQYSDIARSLMAQLEITPQDQQFQTVARMQEEQSRAAMAMMEALSKGRDNSELVAALLANQTQIADALTRLAATAAPASEPKPPANAPKPKQPEGK